MEWGVAVTALLSITAISHLYALVEALRRVPLLDHLVSGEQRATALMAFVTMFPTTLILGAAFPIIMKLYTTPHDPADADPAFVGVRQPHQQLHERALPNAGRP